MKKLLTFMLVMMAGAGIVLSQSITVVQPNGGEKLLRGDTDGYVIKWIASGTSNGFKITLWRGGTLVGKLGEKSAGNGPRNWNWTPPGQLENGSWVTNATDYIVKVKELTTPVADTSDAVFEIYDIRIPDDKLKDILRGLREIPWWEKGPFPPGPDPCLSCELEFDISKLINILKERGLKEEVGIILFKGKEEVAELGKFAPETRLGNRMMKDNKMLKVNKLSRMGLVQNRVVLKDLKLQNRKMLGRGGKGFRIALINSNGLVIAEQAIILQEKMLEK